MGFVSRPVRETLALDTLKSNCRTFSVFDLAGVPLEVPFGHIVQMGFADRMMRPVDRALHQTKAALCSIGIHVAAHVFVGTVIDRLVASKLFADVKVLAALIGHQRRLAADVCDDERAEISATDIRYAERIRMAVALNQRKDWLLSLAANVAFPALADVLVLLFAAHVRLVGLNDLAVAAERTARLGRHGCADTVRHKPTAFVRDPEHAT